MSGDTAERARQIRLKFEESRDPRVRELARAAPDAGEMAALLAAYEGAADPDSFEVRFLAPGRSGAKVFLLTHTVNLPVVVKVGARVDVERELRNYRDYKVEDTLPQELRPTLRFNEELNDYALVVYTWAGGWDRVMSFRDFFASADPETVVRVTDSLMADMFRWHRTSRSAGLPFDQWSWDGGTLAAVRTAVATWPAAEEAKLRVLAVLEEQHDWRDALATMRGSRAVCHGDLNCNNVLLSERAGVLSPKVIDFASVTAGSSPARDWAKFEREIKLRCMRELIPDPAEYVKALTLLDAQLGGGHGGVETDPRVAKVYRVVEEVRCNYEALTANISDIPLVEYLYYLLCWALAYLANQDGLAEPVEVRNAILNSALRAIEQLDVECSRRGKRVEVVSKGTPAAPPSASADFDYVRSLGGEFLSQLRITGYLEDANRVRRAMYLDDGLYVHRRAEEEALRGRVEDFASSRYGVGGWVSITGDAGHGKSSLLWFLYSELQRDTRLRVVPVLAQMRGGLGEVASKVLKPETQTGASAPKTVVLVDTLDILVGIDDPGLAETINMMRARGWLVVTTSRLQEAERLERIVQSDERVHLRRYSDEEAREAIRNYVRLAYPASSAEDKERQSVTLWNVLEQQREVRELDLEPLILRMIFEAYAPHEIPRDVNTQKVYKKYWDERVLSDRAVKDVAEKVQREEVCRLVAAGILFGESRSDKLAVSVAAGMWGTRYGKEFPFEVLAKLISSGVLQWAEGAGSVRFFHQTFLEYAAAYDVRCSDETTLRRRADFLLDAVAGFDLFRAPALKQLVVQAFEAQPSLAHELMERLREVGNALAAQIAFEVVGKAEDDERAVALCERWIAEERQTLQGVVCDVVRHYPGSKTNVALRLLTPLLDTPKAATIYSMCGSIFSRSSPGLAGDFLRTRLERVKGGSDDEQLSYKNALCAVVGRGQLAAVGELTELLPHLKTGQQAGLVREFAGVLDGSNAVPVAALMREVCALAAEKGKKRNEIWVELLKFVAKLKEVAPDAARGLALWLRDSKLWRMSDAAAIYAGQIEGSVLLSPQAIDAALESLNSSDHRARMLSGGILSGAPAEYSSLILEKILTLDPSRHDGDAFASTLFGVVASLKSPEPARLFRFLEEWSPSGDGAGAPLRRILASLAEGSPDEVRAWLLQAFDSSGGSPGKGFFRAFSVLLQENSSIFESGLVRRVFEAGLAAPPQSKRLLVGSVAAVAAVDRALADELFLKFFKNHSRVYRVAAVHSLRYCLTTYPEFALLQGNRIIDSIKAKPDIGILDTYLVGLKDFPRERAADLLLSLDGWFTPELLKGLQDEKVLSEFLAVLKIGCVSDPRLAFQVGRRVPVISKGVAGGLAALYDQVSARGEHDEELLKEVLGGVQEICGYDQMRMGNAIQRILPRLSRGLGAKVVAEWALETCRQIKNEQALNTFVKAALELPGWGEEETDALLRSEWVPNSTVWIVLTKKSEG